MHSSSAFTGTVRQATQPLIQRSRAELPVPARRVQEGGCCGFAPKADTFNAQVHVYFQRLQVKVKFASGGPTQRAPGMLVRLRSGGWCGDFRSSALLAWHLKATRNLPGAQAAAASGGANFRFAACTPSRTPVGLRLPGEESTTTSAGVCACRSAAGPVAAYQGAPDAGFNPVS
jgi:hypothetical protein